MSSMIVDGKCVGCGEWDGECCCAVYEYEQILEAEIAARRKDVVVSGEAGRDFAAVLAPGSGEEIVTAEAIMGGMAQVVGEVDTEKVARGDYSDGGCYAAFFSAGARKKLCTFTSIPRIIPVSVLALLSYALQISSDKFFSMETEAGSGLMHVQEPVGVGQKRQAITAFSWLKAYVDGSGVFAGRSDLWFGAYDHWYFDGDHGKFERSQWIDSERLGAFMRIALASNFQKQNMRDALFTELDGAVGFGLVSQNERFPSHGSYLCLSEAGWDDAVGQLLTALRYKDRSKDAKAKAGVRDDGVERESDYNDSLNAFWLGLASTMRKVEAGFGIYNRQAFESRLDLKWEGESDKAPTSVYHGWSPRAEAVGHMPWIPSSKVPMMHRLLSGLNPALGEHRGRMMTIVGEYLASRQPFDVGRVAAKTQAYVSVARGDWSLKMTTIGRVAGHQDSTKDEKFKAGQDLKIADQKNDNSDTQRAYQKTLQMIAKQYARGEGVMPWDGIEHWLGLSR